MGGGRPWGGMMIVLETLSHDDLSHDDLSHDDWRPSPIPHQEGAPDGG